MPKPHPNAELKTYKDLEVWEWREDGILKIELTGVGVLEDYQADEFGGDWVQEDYYAIIVEEDCDVYKPRSEDALAMFEGESTEEDRLLVSFRKNVIPKKMCDEALEILRPAAGISDNRGMAGGKVDKNKLRTIAKDGEIRFSGRGTRVQYKLPDGSWSVTTAANRVMSGIAGYFDASPRHPFCRKTGFYKSNERELEDAIPFLENVNQQFRNQAPVRWQRQKDFVDDNGIFPNGWCLGDTVFTTITVNKNWQTAVHKDAGDFPGGYGNLSVLVGKPYKGGATGFPKYKVAVRALHGDFLAMDVHEWHGNTPMTPLEDPPEGEEWTEENPGFERISVVCYARYGMRHCGSQEVEKQKYEEWHDKFVAPKAKQKIMMQENAARVEAAEEEFEEMKHLVED